MGTCLRYAGQYGDAATCAEPACNWGAGLLAWMLDSAQSVVDTVIPWPTLIGAASENQVGGKASQLTYDDGELCLLYTSPSPRDATLSRMPSSA